MKEDLLHFIWQSKLLLSQTITTVSGEPIRIVQLGTYNRNAGPDFFNAKLYIGDTLWVGNVEMHLLSSDWNTHKHQYDNAYNNVILHVVLHHDKDVQNKEGQTLPTLELRQFIPTSLLKKYERLQQQSSTAIACKPILVKPPAPVFHNWLQRLLVERIEHKCEDIERLLAETEQYWELCFYYFTARYFGMKTNSPPFEQLARALPLSLLSKYKNNLQSIVALLVGTAGLFDKFSDDVKALQPLYNHLRTKHQLTPLDGSIWKFARTRPANFPSERLLQFAALIYHSSHLFSKVLACNAVGELRALYAVSITIDGRTVSMGKTSVDVVLINSVIPFVFMYGKLQHKEAYMEKALTWYEQLPAENNIITRQFTALGFEHKNAGQSQAYIQLKNEYCTPLQCLHCSIGYHSLTHE